MLYLPMPEVILQRPRVLSVVSDVEAAGVTQQCVGGRRTENRYSKPTVLASGQNRGAPTASRARSRTQTLIPAPAHASAGATPEAPGPTTGAGPLVLV